MTVPTHLYLSCMRENVSDSDTSIFVHSAERRNATDTFDKDRDAMNYFRAVSAAEEHSERGLELTEMIIRRNPAHYTVW